MDNYITTNLLSIVILIQTILFINVCIFEIEDDAWHIVMRHVQSNYIDMGHINISN